MLRLITARTINPAVRAMAELACDGPVSEAFLADIAAREGLPLYVPAAPPRLPCPDDRTQAALASARQRVANGRLAYVAARNRLGTASKRPPHLTAESRRRASLSDRRYAMGDLNRCRARLHAAERALAEAIARIDAARIPLLMAAE